MFNLTTNYSYVTKAFWDKFSGCRFKDTRLKAPQLSNQKVYGITLQNTARKDIFAEPKRKQIAFRFEDAATKMMSRLIIVDAVLLRDASMELTLIVGGDEIETMNLYLADYGNRLTGNIATTVGKLGATINTNIHQWLLSTVRVHVRVNRNKVVAPALYGPQKENLFQPMDIGGVCREVPKILADPTKVMLNNIKH